MMALLVPVPHVDWADIEPARVCIHGEAYNWYTAFDYYCDAYEGADAEDAWAHLADARPYYDESHRDRARVPRAPQADPRHAGESLSRGP